MGSKRVGHDLVTKQQHIFINTHTHAHTHTHIHRDTDHPLLLTRTCMGILKHLSLRRWGMGMAHGFHGFLADFPLHWGGSVTRSD